MASTVTIVDRAPNSILYAVAEDGTAAGLTTRNVIADLEAATAVGVAGDPQPNSPIIPLINDAFANQAAAQAVLYSNFDIEVYTPVVAAPTNLQITADVSAPAVAENFRFTILPVKTAAADVNTYHVRLALRHSIID